MFDETTAGIDLRHIAPTVTRAARLRVPVDGHLGQIGIVHVMLTRAVTLLAADAIFCPRADQPRQTVLVAFGPVASGVAGATAIGFLFPRVIGYPILIHLQILVIEIVLGGGADVTGDDKALLIDKAGLPAIAADDVGNVIPRVAFGGIGHFGEGIGGGLPVHHFVQFIGVSRLSIGGVEFLVAFLTGIRADVDGRRKGNPGRTSSARKTGRASGPGRAGHPFGSLGAGRANRTGWANIPRHACAGGQQCQNENQADNGYDAPHSSPPNTLM